MWNLLEKKLIKTILKIGRLNDKNRSLSKNFMTAKASKISHSIKTIEETKFIP